MRSRNKYSHPSFTGRSWHHTGNPDQPTDLNVETGNRQEPRYQKYSSITDQTNTYVKAQSGKRYRPVSPCFHQKAYMFPTPYSGVSMSPYSQYGIYYNSVALCGASDITNVMPQFDLKGLDDELYHLFRKKYASLGNEFSLTNDLLEAHEMGEMVQKAIKLANSFKNVRQGGPGAPGGPNGNPKGIGLNSPIDDVLANRPRYLDWAFGIKPVIDDLKALRRNLQNTAWQISHLNRTKVQTFNGKFNVDKRVDYPDQDWGWNGIDFHVHSPRSSGHYSGKMIVHLPEMNGVAATLRGLADLIGLHLDTGVLYDALPFSWLADWVADWGKHLKDNADRRWYQPQIYLAGACWTVKARIDITAVKHYPDSFYPDLPGGTVGSGYVQTFTRQPFAYRMVGGDGAPESPEPEWKNPLPESLSGWLTLGGLTRKI